jgi:gliding motility-associated-like protein
MILPCDTSSITITDSTDVGCFGDSTGRAVVKPIGMHGTVTYSWSHGDSDSIADNLAAGPYSVTVTDDSSCTDSGTVFIDQPPALSLSTSDTNATCNVNDGKAVVNATGGSPPYDYQWNSGDTTAVADSLSPGLYTVTVTDTNSCSDTAQLTVEADTLALSLSTTAASCGNNDGSATVSVANGTSPYTYQWSNGDTTATADSLDAGTYIVTVTDANNCQDSSTATITNPGSPAISLVDSSNPSCYGNDGGTITVSGSGGNRPYTYHWDPNVSNDSTATGLSGGTYSITIEDDDSCESPPLQVTLKEPDSLNTTLQTTPTRCDSATGSAQASVSGGTSPYTYLWSTGALSDSIGKLSAGDYTLIVEDDQGCRDTVMPVITTYASPTFNIRPDTTVKPDNKVPLWVSPDTFPDIEWSPADYLDDPDAIRPLSTPEKSILYFVNITNSRGCTTKDSVQITVEELPEETSLFVPTAFSPNEDGVNDIWRVEGPVQDIEIIIYDRWGNKVFETTDIQEGWDGTYRGKKAASGVYVYHITGTLLDGSSFERKGNISLFR